MKTITLYAVLLLLLALNSCSTIHHTYVVVECPDLEKTNQRGFVDDYDSIKVYYSFQGRNMPLVITIENNCSQGVLIDWSRTAFIVDGVLHSVVNPNSKQDITSTTNAFWDGETYVVSETIRSGELQKKYVPSNTKFIFLVRHFREWAPASREAILNTRKLEYMDQLPTEELIKKNVYHAEKIDYPQLKVMLPIYFEHQESKKIQMENTFFVTQQYRLKRNQDNQFNRQFAYADRGYFLNELPDPGSSFVAGLFWVGATVGLIALVMNTDYSGDYSSDDYDEDYYYGD